MDWDAKKISDQLWREVDNLETYERELHGRVLRRDPRASSSQAMADRISGETSLLRQVASSAELSTRARFLAEIRRLLDVGDALPPQSSDTNPKLHQQGWEHKCRELIARFVE